MTDRQLLLTFLDKTNIGYELDSFNNILLVADTEPGKDIVYPCIFNFDKDGKSKGCRRFHLQ